MITENLQAGGKICFPVSGKIQFGKHNREETNQKEIMRSRSRTYPLPLSQQQQLNQDSVIQSIRHYHSIDARSFCYIRSTNEVWCGQKDGTIIVRNASNASVVTSLVGIISNPFQCRTTRSTPTHVIVFTIVGQNMWCGCANGQIQIWSIRRRCLLQTTINSHSASITDMMVCNTYQASQQHNSANEPSQLLVVSSGADGTMKFWTDDGKLIHTSFGLNSWINCMIDIGDRIWTGSDDGVIRVWNFAGSVVSQLKAHEQSILQLMYEPRTNRIWTSCKGGMINVWSIDNDIPHLLKSICCLHSMVNCLYTTNGIVLAASNDRKVRVFKASNAEQINEISMMKGYVRALMSVKNVIWMSLSNRSIHVYKLLKMPDSIDDDFKIGDDEEDEVIFRNDSITNSLDLLDEFSVTSNVSHDELSTLSNSTINFLSPIQLKRNSNESSVMTNEVPPSPMFSFISVDKGASLLDTPSVTSPICTPAAANSNALHLNHTSVATNTDFSNQTLNDTTTSNMANTMSQAQLELSIREIEEKKMELNHKKRILDDSLHEIRLEKKRFADEKSKFETEVKKIQASVEKQRIQFMERENELNKRLEFVDAHRVELNKPNPFHNTKMLSEIVQHMVQRLNRAYRSNYPLELDHSFHNGSNSKHCYTPKY